MSTEEQVRRKARALAAFMTQADAMGFAQSFVLDIPAFEQGWKARAGARAKMAAGYATPKIEEMPQSASQHLAKLTAHQAFVPVYGKAVEFKMIELGKCVAFQHWMDTDVSDGVHGAGNGGTPSFDEMLAKCLPVDLVPASRMWWNAERQPNRFSLSTYSHNNTLNFEHGFDQNNGVVQFLITTAPNLMLVVEHGGRYILMNGYHRAWWLRSRGIEMVPVIIRHETNPAAIAKPGFIQPDVLLSDKPPLFDHFLDDTVSLSVDVRSMLKVVKVTAEVSFVPRLL